MYLALVIVLFVWAVKQNTAFQGILAAFLAAFPWSIGASWQPSGLLGSFSPTNRGFLAAFLAVFPQPIRASWQLFWASWQPIGWGKAAKMPGKAAKKAAKMSGKAAKKPLLVREKLPRSPEKLPRRLPRCTYYWSGKSCQEESINWGKATKKPLFISLPKQTIL